MHGYTYSRPDQNVEGAMQGENMLELFQMFRDNENRLFTILEAVKWLPDGRAQIAVPACASNPIKKYTLVNQHLIWKTYIH